MRNLFCYLASPVSHMLSQLSKWWKVNPPAEVYEKNIALQTWKSPLISPRLLILQHFKKKEAKRKTESVFPKGRGKTSSRLDFVYSIWASRKNKKKKKKKKNVCCLLVVCLFVCTLILWKVLLLIWDVFFPSIACDSKGWIITKQFVYNRKKKYPRILIRSKWFQRLKYCYFALNKCNGPLIVLFAEMFCGDFWLSDTWLLSHTA